MADSELAPHHSVLIVDDDPDLLDLLRMYFQDEGFTCNTAAWGPEGLQKVRTLHPDVILLDVMMPTQSGYDVLMLLRDDPATRAIPVILMSGLSTLDRRILGYVDGADGWLPKPFDLCELSHMIAVALRHHLPRPPEEEDDAC